MSIPVELSNLAATLARYRFAYLMTTSTSGAPHAVAVSVQMQGAELVINPIGRRTSNNARAHPAVGLVWPPPTETDYSLIVDGQATVGEGSMRIIPQRAVLHRPAPSEAGQARAPGHAT